VQVLVTGEHGAVDDPRWPVFSARGGRQYREGESLKTVLDAVDELGFDRYPGW
jgi:hypothetical protein